MTDSYIDVHTHKYREDIISILSLEPCELGRDFKGDFSCGVHPWRVNLQELDLLYDLPVIAIGEIGLDYAVRDLDKDLQREVFCRQLQLAEQRKLPVVIHCVRAYYELLSQLKDYDLKAVVFHGFVGGEQLVKVIVEQGYYISLGIRSLSSAKTLKALAHLPKDRLFLETDESDMKIEEIYALASKHLAMDLGELKQQIFNNYNTVFK